MAIFIDILVNNGSHSGSLLIIYRNGPNRTAALGSDEHSLLGCPFAAFVGHTRLRNRVTPNIHFVQFDDTG